MSDLLVIVPSRGRPESLERVVAAWEATGAFDESASLIFAVDKDDPYVLDYRAALERPELGRHHRARHIAVMNCGSWQPMVAKLNRVAGMFAEQGHFALGFAGDDHLPRTRGWAGRYLDALREMGTGIVYGDDLLQGRALPTQWAMTSDIVRTLGRMVPAPVEHMYCDNSVMRLGRLAGCLRYLPDVVIEHCHPLAGKAEWDTGYVRVNRTEQYERDELAYRDWLDHGWVTDAEKVKKLMRKDLADAPVRNGC